MMDNFELLQQILTAGEKDEQRGFAIVTVLVHYLANAVRLVNTIGPIEPRTRTVEFSPSGDGHKVIYQEVTHGLAQPETTTQVDTTNAAAVSALIADIWSYLKG
jgi:hypothetical protein